MNYEHSFAVQNKEITSDHLNILHSWAFGFAPVAKF